MKATLLETFKPYNYFKSLISFLIISKVMTNLSGAQYTAPGKALKRLRRSKSEHEDQ